MECLISWLSSIWNLIDGCGMMLLGCKCMRKFNSWNRNSHLMWGMWREAPRLSPVPREELYFNYLEATFKVSIPNLSWSMRLKIKWNKSNIAKLFKLLGLIDSILIYSSILTKRDLYKMQAKYYKKFKELTSLTY